MTNLFVLHHAQCTEIYTKKIQDSDIYASSWVPSTCNYCFDLLHLKCKMYFLMPWKFSYKRILCSNPTMDTTMRQTQKHEGMDAPKGSQTE
jgi:hypothetical protein